MTFLVGNLITPISEKNAQQIKISSTDGSVSTDFKSGVWMKDGNNFVNIENVLPDASLRDIHIYEFDNDVLLPFELYSFPRVMAIQGGFKRINEIISIQGRRIIHKHVTHEAQLTGKVYLKKLFVHKNIVYACFKSETSNSKGDIIMTSYDTAILLNETDKDYFKRIVRRKINSIKKLPENFKSIKINDLKLFFRHHWDEKIWINIENSCHN